MTRDDAKDIIAVALQADAHSDSTANLFAQQLATALDALGLLASATSDNQERNPTEEIAAAARIVSGNPLPLPEMPNAAEQHPWATNRKR